MKKQRTVKKLALQKETLVQLQQVSGGKIISYYNTVAIDDTVYYPVQSDYCSRGCGSWA
jgi:hypothetical protein